MDVLARRLWIVIPSGSRAVGHGLVEHLYHAVVFIVTEAVLVAVKGTPQEFWQFEGGRSEWSIQYGLCGRRAIFVQGGQLAIHQDGQ